MSSPADSLPERILQLYGRPGCHLCDDARAVVQRIAADHAFVLQEVDIESDDVLLKAYLERIPVLVLDGQELYDFFVDEADLRTRLSAGATH
jgi:glutaredoxin